MRTNLIFPLLLLGVLFLYGCTDNGQEEIIDTVRVPIELSTGHTMSPQLKSAGVFPNKQTIAVTAAVYNDGLEDWTGYTDLINKTAKVISYNSDNETYGFSWNEQQYWPMEDTELVFMAYSPAAKSGTAVELSDDKTFLYLTIQQDMPDVLYAENNGVRGFYKKTGNNTVNLGEFEHALTKLTVIVQKDQDMNPDIRLSNLHITTTYKNAMVDLLRRTVTLSPMVIDSEAFRFELVKDGQVNFYNTPFEQYVLLFAGTESSTRVYIELKDGPVTVENQFNITQFTETDPIVFEQGKNVVLTIHIKGEQIQNSTENIVLKGELKPWEDKGDYEVIIK